MPPGTFFAAVTFEGLGVVSYQTVTKFEIYFGLYESSMHF